MNISTTELMGGGYDWLKPVSNAIGNVAGSIWGGGSTSPVPAVINVNPSSSSSMSWVPIAIGGVVLVALVGALTMGKRRRRR